MWFTATWWFFASKGSKKASECDVVVIRNSKIEHVLPYKSLTNQDISLRFGQLVLWTISIKCGFLLHDGFLPLRGRKMHRKVTSLSSETLKLNIFYSFLKTFSLQIGPRELLRLAHSELQEWQETAHTNSYIPVTIWKCSKYYFQCVNCVTVQP